MLLLMIILIGCDCLLSWLLQFCRAFSGQKKRFPDRSRKARWKRPLVLRLLKVSSARFVDWLAERRPDWPEKGGKKPLTSGRGYVNLVCNEVPSCVNESEIVHFLLSWFRVVKFTSERSYSLIHRRRLEIFSEGATWRQQFKCFGVWWTS